MLKINSPKDHKTHLTLATKSPDQFWQKIAQNFHWFKDFDKTSDCDFKTQKFSWFLGGKTNIAYNCLDANIKKGYGDKTAFIFEPNDPAQKSQKITYQELLDLVCKFANLLKSQGVKPQDRVAIYMPMTIEGVAAMLACARIGATHSVIFAGFSAKALSSRINDCGAKILITADFLFRGGKELELFKIAQEALETSPGVKSVILFNRRNQNYTSKNYQITDLTTELAKQSPDCPAHHAESEDKLFILYTSGSTGTPKGIFHAHAGYMVYAAYSFANVFNHQSDDVFFCSADIGWITGHSYLTYGSLLNAATSVIFEGVPTYPSPNRFFEIIDKHQVSIFYTAPTAIRALMQNSEELGKNSNLTSLKTLGSVGEPINQEAYDWYSQKFGNNKCAIVDTWWQTETGGIMISNLAHLTTSKASFAGKPLPGIFPILLDKNGQKITKPNENGALCIEKPWPSMARGVYGNQEKFRKTYYQDFPGHYFAGDGAFFDKDGDFRITGRIDDVINVSGHRLGTAEIENAINTHLSIAESAVIAYPHEVKGQGICAFAIPKQGEKVEKQEILELVKEQIGAIAKPDQIHVVADLPKTRSGKIMRRILKKIVSGQGELGDVSTLVNPEVVAVIEGVVGQGAR